MKLTDILCKSIKPKDRPYKNSDGGGLYLLVNPSGSKLWRMKYYYLGVEKTLSIGQYPIVSLAQAREERDKAKKLLSANPPIDPNEDKKSNKRELIRKTENSFKAVALEWFEYNEDTWSKRYKEKVTRCFELHVFPYIGHRPISDITTPELIDLCFKKLEGKKIYDTVRRVRYVCGQIFRYGIQRGKCQTNPVDHLKGAFKTKENEHHRTLDFNRIPDFLKALERNEARLYERTRNAIWFSLYTFQRPGEIRKARWSDINLEEKLWSIPKEQMKMKRDHIVPLSDQAVTILLKQKEEVKNLKSDWVFPSQPMPKKPMSDGTVNTALKRLGFGKEIVAHGFRALARTTIHEKLRYNGEIIEKQLAHKTNNPLGEAYDRTQFLEDRIKMMQDWANYLDTLKQ